MHLRLFLRHSTFSTRFLLLENRETRPRTRTTATSSGQEDERHFIA